MGEQPHEPLTRKRVAELLGMTKSGVRGLERRGVLHPVLDQDHRYVFHREEVLAVLKARTPSRTPQTHVITHVPTEELPESAQTGQPDHGHDLSPPPEIAEAVTADNEVVAAWKAAELARAREAEAAAELEAAQHAAHVEAIRAEALRRASEERLAALLLGRERGERAAVERAARAALAADPGDWARVEATVEAATRHYRAQLALDAQRRLRQQALTGLHARLIAGGWPRHLVDAAVSAAQHDQARLDGATLYGPTWLRSRALAVACSVLGVPAPQPPMVMGEHGWRAVGAGE